MTLRELGYPTHAEVRALKLTGSQFMDIVRWMMRGRRRFGDGWVRRVHILSGWEVLNFIESVSKDTH